jgi:hypothetical protein
MEYEFGYEPGAKIKTYNKKNLKASLNNLKYQIYTFSIFFLLEEHLITQVTPLTYQYKDSQLKLLPRAHKNPPTFLKQEPYMYRYSRTSGRLTGGGSGSASSSMMNRSIAAGLSTRSSALNMQIIISKVIGGETSVTGL